MELNKLFYILLFFSSLIHSQDNKSERTIEKNSISANILGTGSYVGVSYERLFFNRMYAEVGVGIIGFGLGATVYPFKKISRNQVNPYLGIKYTNHAIVDGENKSATYIPIGVTYFTKSKINLHLDVGPAYFYHISPGYKPTAEEKLKYPYSNYGFWGNFKVSFRF